MSSSQPHQELIEFLQHDRMRNIVPLKMLATHGAAIQTHFLEEGKEAGALLYFPTDAFAYDRQTYHDRDLVVLLVASSLTLVDALLAYLPRKQKVVFKLADQAIQQQVARHFSLTHVRTFISYTTPPHAVLPQHTDVQMGTVVDERLYDLYAEYGHSAAEIAGYFADHEARAFTLYREEQPLAASFTYTNFADVHEVGGVLTIPTERRKGYAKLVVEQALFMLQQRGYSPRYQVNATNRASIQLAQSIGLIPFVTVEHWLNS